jgi:hypothetical protein
VSFSWRVIWRNVGQVADRANDLLHTAWNFWLNTRPNSGCVAAATAAGAAGGAVIGGEAGYGLGAARGAGGAIGGTFVEPGGGTAVGFLGGGALGGAAGGVAGAGVGGAGGWLVGQVACRTGGGGGGGGGRGWKLGSGKSATKWANQMRARGWTEAQIDEAIEHGAQYPAVNNVNPANGATRFVSPTTGRSVVLDNVTKEVIHVGGDGFKY